MTRRNKRRLQSNEGRRQGKEEFEIKETDKMGMKRKGKKKKIKNYIRIRDIVKNAIRRR